MCGIGGIFAYDERAASVRREELEAINTAMFSRGPDAGSTWISNDARVGLANRRLAIIDLSAEGTQPMFDTSGELVIAFNGEIYNYAELRASLTRRGATFHSHTDTEVLLQLYRHDGERMLGRMRGMYAFAIWDSREQRLFVARDPYGIKPLYFADDGKTFRFASQVKALLADGGVSKTRDVAGAAGFFLTGSVPEPFTMYESIRAVEAGTAFHVDARGRGAARKHYSISSIYAAADEQRHLAHLAEPETLLCEHVRESVRYHLVADVPVGVFLSAGIDSAAVASIARHEVSSPLQTFTLTFDVFRGTEIDEAPLAEAFAASIGARHTTRVVTAEEFRADLPRIFAAMDQPTIDGVNTFFVSKIAHEAGVKVALSGLGGDELFGSYPSFSSIPKIVRAASAGARMPRLSERALRLATAAHLINPKAAAIPRYGATYGGAYLVKRGLHMPWELADILGADAAEEGLRRLAPFTLFSEPLQPDPGTPFARIATLESSLYMRNQLLRDTDWASMAHSVEVRTPLVDAMLLRQIAPLLLVHGSQTKQAFGAILPEWLRNRPKRGFVVPLKDWANLPPDGTGTRMRSWAKVVYDSY
ncbi:MAG TPA: asparagine synthase (glutamine-hydrolyzing) [Thermoanaerobaculia bacterium]|nr:asparagine synthase (glutamine-hydrolyzing) [Thermoanaerobaculia bacterium]